MTFYIKLSDNNDKITAIMSRQDYFFSSDNSLHNFLPNQENSTKFLLRRSNALRKRTRPLILCKNVKFCNNQVQREVKKPARMMENYRKLQENREIQNNYRILTIFTQIKRKKIGQYLRGGQCGKTTDISWFLRWKYRRIHPFCDNR